MELLSKNHRALQGSKMTHRNRPAKNLVKLADRGSPYRFSAQIGTNRYCSDTQVSAKQIVVWFAWRWNIEVTFEELRAFLGFETQRQWSDRAIERTTPCLFGIFSLVTIMAKVLYPTNLPVRQNSWYIKDDATFSDALAAVRRHLWSRLNYKRSSQNPDLFLIPQPALFSLVESACYST